MLAAAKAARNAPRLTGRRVPVDLLLDGLAIRFTDGYAASAAALKRALAAVRDEGDRRRAGHALAVDRASGRARTCSTTRRGMRSPPATCRSPRDAGALAVLPLALNLLSLVRCFEGQLAAAAALLEEADEIAEATGTEPIVFGRVLLAGCRGDETDGLGADRGQRGGGERAQ